RELANQSRQSGLKRCDLLLDRSRAGPHLQSSARKEASPGKRALHQVVEEGVTHGKELTKSRRSGQRRFDDLGLKDPFGLVPGRRLEVLLRPEVGIDAALSHVECAGEIADRQAFESVERRQ